MKLPTLVILAVRALLVSLLVSLLVVVAAGVAYGDEDDGSVYLEAGQVAPSSGVLVSEERIDRAIRSAIDLEECKGNLVASERVRSSLTEELANEIARQPPAIVPHSEWPWVVLGFVAGAAAAGLAVWGSVEVLRAR